MKIEQEFTLDRPRPEVWAFFKDVPAVAACMPGAEYLGEEAPGRHNGRMSVKVGPFQASFEGVADVVYSDETHSVSMVGKGVDKRGASRGKMKLECALHDEGEGTRVTVDADVQLSGSIAQFGRTGIIQEIASTLIADFVSNVEETLAPSEVSSRGTAASEAPGEGDKGPQQPQAKGSGRALSGTRLMWIALRNWLRSLLGRRH